MTKRCPDYALPEMVWPGIKEQKRGEDTAKKSAGKNEPEGKIQGDWNVDKIESEDMLRFLEKAKGILRSSDAHFIHADCSNEGHLLDFFGKANFNEKRALFQLQATLGMGVLEAMEVIRQDNDANTTAPYSAKPGVEPPARNAWLASTRRCMVRGATPEELVQRYEEGCVLLSKAPKYTGSSSRVHSDVLERLEKIKKRLQISKLLRARAADFTARHSHLPRSSLMEIRGLTQSASSAKVKMPLAMEIIRDQVSNAQTWEKRAAAHLGENDDEDDDNENSHDDDDECKRKTHSYVSLTRLIEDGRELRVDLVRLPMLEAKQRRVRHLLDTLRRFCKPSVSKTAQQRWVKWGLCPDDIIPSARPTLPLIRSVVKEIEFLNIDAPEVDRARLAVAKAEEWLARFEATRNAHVTPSLDSLQNLANEASELVVDVSEESKPLNDAIERALGWVTNVRGTAIAGSLRHRKSRAGKRSDGRSRLKLSQLIELVRQADALGFATKETTRLKELLAKVNHWSMTVREHLARCRREYEVEASGGQEAAKPTNETADADATAATKTTTKIEGDHDRVATEAIKEDTDTPSKTNDDDDDEEMSESEDEVTLLEALKELEDQVDTSLPIDDMPEEGLLRAEIGVREWRERLDEEMFKRSSLKVLEKLLRESEDIEDDEDWPYARDGQTNSENETATTTTTTTPPVREGDANAQSAKEHLGFSLGKKRLLNVLIVAREWAEKAERVLAQQESTDVSKISAAASEPEHVSALIAEAETVAVDFSEEIASLKELVDKFAVWKEKVRELLAANVSRPSFEKAKTLFDDIRRMNLNCDEREELESSFLQVQKWNESAANLLAGRVSKDRNAPSKAQKLLSSENALRFSPADADAVEKIRHSLALAEKWRIRVVSALETARSRCSEMEQTVGSQLVSSTANSSDDFLRIFVLTPSFDFLTLRISRIEWQRHCVASLVSAIERWIRKHAELSVVSDASLAKDSNGVADGTTPKKSDAEETPIIVLKGTSVLGVSEEANLTGDANLGSSSLRDGDILFCVRANMLENRYRLTDDVDNVHVGPKDYRWMSLSRIGKVAASINSDILRTEMEKEAVAFKCEIALFDAPLQASEIANELLGQLDSLLGEKEALICASHSQEYVALAQFLFDLKWCQRSSTYLQKRGKMVMSVLQELVSTGANVRNRFMASALSRWSALLKATTARRQMIDDAFDAVDTGLANDVEGGAGRSSSRRDSRRRGNRKRVSGQSKDRKISRPELGRLLLLGEMECIKDERTSRLENEISRVNMWRLEARAALGGQRSGFDSRSKKRTRKQFESMLEGGKRLVCDVPEISQIQSLLQTCAEWQTRIEAAQLSAPLSGSSKVTALLKEGRALPVDLDEVIGPIEESMQVYCLCRMNSGNDKNMIGCDYCDEWYHFSCVGLSVDEGNGLEKYRCPRCRIVHEAKQAKDLSVTFLEARHLASTLKDKSSSLPSATPNRIDPWAKEFFFKKISQANILTPEAAQKTSFASPDALNGAYAWLSRSALLAPFIVDTSVEGSKEEEGEGSERNEEAGTIVPPQRRTRLLMAEMKSMLQLVVDKAYGKVCTEVLLRSVLYRLIATFVWCVDAYACFCCKGRSKPSLEALERLVTDARSRKMASVVSKDLFNLPLDYIKRCNAWMRNVPKLLHSEKKTSHHMRKLKKLQSKRRDLPVDSKRIEQTEKILKGSIENNGHCICQDCAEKKRKDDEVAAMRMRAATAAPVAITTTGDVATNGVSNLINAQQIREMMRGQLGDSRSHGAALMPYGHTAASAFHRGNSQATLAYNQSIRFMAEQKLGPHHPFATGRADPKLSQAIHSTSSGADAAAAMTAHSALIAKRPNMGDVLAGENPAKRARMGVDALAIGHSAPPPPPCSTRNHASNASYMMDMKRAYKALSGGGDDDVPGVSEEKSPAVRGSSPTRSSPLVAKKSRSIDNMCSSGNAKGWKRGPIDERGVLFKASERPLMCLAVSPNERSREAVVGSSDHALYVFNFASGKKTRQLYSKRFGHQEWVTCVSYTADGRIVSGGMDSKICVWNGSRCDDLRGHTSSVSLLRCGDKSAPNIAVSGSYDRSIRVWNLKTKKSVAKLGGTKDAHRGAILCLDWSEGGYLFSGARDGSVALWDLAHPTSNPVRKFLSASGGHVTSVATFGGSSSAAMRITGHQDGCVRLWDVRDRSSKESVVIPAHRTKSGKAGAVSSIVCSNAKDDLEHIGGNVVVTAGADGAVCVLDPRSSLKPCIRFEHHRDFVYTLRCVGSLAVSGSGDGTIYVHDLTSGKLLYGIGANQHAVRCIEARRDCMIAAGDDGSALTFSFR
eukprot:g2346.t1